MKSIVGILVAGVVLAVGGVADAQVLTFDEMSPSQNPILGTVVCANGTGFRFVSDHFHLIGGTFVQDFSSNGTSHIGYESGRGFPIAMERVGGGTFSLLSLDVAEFYNGPTDRPDAETITITGVQQGGTMVSHTVSVDGIRDGPGGVADFEHVVLPATFVNLTSVVFTGLRAGDLPGGIALDNFEYQLAVPETLAPCVATPLPPDTPTVSFVSPSAGNVVGTVLIEANASDNLGVASVQFRLDGVDLGPADTTAPYSMSWDTTTVPDGQHTLSVEARDAADNVATDSVIVTVANYTVPTSSPHYLDLDGVDDYLQTPDANSLSFGSGAADTPLTIDAWIRPDNMSKQQMLVGKWGEGSNQEYKLHTAAGVIRLDLRDQSAGASSYAFTGSQVSLNGSWHHLAVTYDGRGGATAANGITIYVDGVSVPLTRSNNASYVAMENLTAPLQIGREGPNWKQYEGALDELRLWSVARTQGQIQASMVTELSGGEPGLVGYWRFNEGTGGTVADDSPSNHAATLFNGPVWVEGGPMGPPVPDTTPPSITNIATSNLTDTGITVTFNTSEATTASVSYTATGSCPCTDVPSAGMGAAHVVTLTGLAPTTAYQFVIHATDGASNSQTSSTMSFTTLATPPDTTAPAVVMVHPSAGNVSGTVTVEATATDGVGVVSVQFKLDGVNLGDADLTAPYSLSWDTTTIADGPHTLTAEARDAANNVGTASVVVNVANSPVGSSPYFVDLDGVNDYLQAADANGLSFGSGTADTPLTIEMWFRPENMSRQQMLVGKWGEGTNQEYKLHTAAGVIRLDLRDQSAGASTYAFTGSQTALNGGWHHLAVTYDGRGGATAANGITMYIDGVSVPLTRVNNAAYVAMENLTAPLQIGREGPNWKQYDGALDELRMWNVWRTSSEIQAWMSTGLTGAEPGLVAYWRFNEGTGTTAADDSPADHTATLVNGAAWLAGGPLP